MSKAIAPKPAAFSRKLAQAMRHQTKEMVQRLEGARKGRPQDVHRGRVASRRLREVLAVLAAVEMPGARRLRRRVRRLTRKLGAVRELDVMLDELGQAARRHAWKHDVVPWRLALGRTRSRQRAALEGTLEKADLDDLREACVRMSKALTLATSNEPWRTAFDRRLAGRAGAVVDTVAACGVDYDPLRLHRLRVAVKKLRYALELAPSTPRRQAFLDELAALQQLLGRWHDLHVLSDAMAHPKSEAPVSKQPSVSAEMSSAAADLDRECRALHTEILPRLKSVATKAAAVALGTRRRMAVDTLEDQRAAHATNRDTSRPA